LYTDDMQPIKQLANILAGLADAEHCLFSLRDLKATIPGQSQAALKVVIGKRGVTI